MKSHLITLYCYNCECYIVAHTPEVSQYVLGIIGHDD